MKKIYFSLMLFATLLVSSCSMNTAPFGALDDKTAIRNVDDLASFRNNIYTNLRGFTSGAWIYLQDLAMDEFVGTITNGNRNGQINSGAITSSDSDLEGMWSSCYSRVNIANKFIEDADRLLADENLSATDKAAITRYRAEAFFMRGFAYFFLADHYCESYTQTNPEGEHSGLPIQLVYNPTGVASEYPDRSSLVATFAQIESDLTEAYNGLKAYEATGAADVPTLLSPNSVYLSSYAVECLQARVALVKGDYPTALAKAKDVIDSHRYALTTIADYAKLWTNDEGTEVIWRPFMSNTELGGSVGGVYLSDNNLTCDYIPTFNTLTLFTDEGDVRFDTYFAVNQGIVAEGNTYVLYQFQKFPGNVTLRTGSSNNFVNMAKPFRLSEMYLIAAEAAARTSVDGSQYMNDFLANRIEEYEPGTFNSNSLLNTALAQRQLEFMGEGFRMSDLRRLGLGFSRTADFPANIFGNLNNIVTVKSTLTYQPDDYRYTWPIPQTELDANPKLKTQQNRGY